MKAQRVAARKLREGEGPGFLALDAVQAWTGADGLAFIIPSACSSVSALWPSLSRSWEGGKGMSLPTQMDVRIKCTFFARDSKFIKIFIVNCCMFLPLPRRGDCNLENQLPSSTFN